MIALTGAFRSFHITEQSVHFRNGKLPVSAHRTMAGHGREQIVLMSLYTFAVAELQHIRQHITNQLLDIGIFEQRRHLAHHD